MDTSAQYLDNTSDITDKCSSHRSPGVPERPHHQRSASDNCRPLSPIEKRRGRSVSPSPYGVTLVFGDSFHQVREERSDPLVKTGTKVSSRSNHRSQLPKEIEAYINDKPSSLVLDQSTSKTLHPNIEMTPESQSLVSRDIQENAEKINSLFAVVKEYNKILKIQEDILKGPQSEESPGDFAKRIIECKEAADALVREIEKQSRESGSQTLGDFVKEQQQCIDEGYQPISGIQSQVSELFRPQHFAEVASEGIKPFQGVLAQTWESFRDKMQEGVQNCIDRHMIDAPNKKMEIASEIYMEDCYLDNPRILLVIEHIWLADMQSAVESHREACKSEELDPLARLSLAEINFYQRQLASISGYLRTRNDILRRLKDALIEYRDANEIATAFAGHDEDEQQLKQLKRNKRTIQRNLKFVKKIEKSFMKFTKSAEILEPDFKQIYEQMRDGDCLFSTNFDPPDTERVKRIEQRFRERYLANDIKKMSQALVGLADRLKAADDIGRVPQVLEKLTACNEMLKAADSTEKMCQTLDNLVACQRMLTVASDAEQALDKLVSMLKFAIETSKEIEDFAACKDILTNISYCNRVMLKLHKEIEDEMIRNPNQDPARLIRKVFERYEHDAGFGGHSDEEKMEIRTGLKLKPEFPITTWVPVTRVLEAKVFMQIVAWGLQMLDMGASFGHGKHFHVSQGLFLFQAIEDGIIKLKSCENVAELFKKAAHPKFRRKFKMWFDMFDGDDRIDDLGLDPGGKELFKGTLWKIGQISGYGNFSRFQGRLLEILPPGYLRGEIGSEFVQTLYFGNESTLGDNSLKKCIIKKIKQLERKRMKWHGRHRYEIDSQVAHLQKKLKNMTLQQLEEYYNERGGKGLSILLMDTLFIDSNMDANYLEVKRRILEGDSESHLKNDPGLYESVNPNPNPSDHPQKTHGLESHLRPDVREQPQDDKPIWYTRQRLEDLTSQRLEARRQQEMEDFSDAIRAVLYERQTIPTNLYSLFDTVEAGIGANVWAIRCLEDKERQEFNKYRSAVLEYWTAHPEAKFSRDRTDGTDSTFKTLRTDIQRYMEFCKKHIEIHVIDHVGAYKLEKLRRVGKKQPLAYLPKDLVTGPHKEELDKILSKAAEERLIIRTFNNGKDVYLYHREGLRKLLQVEATTWPKDVRRFVACVREEYAIPEGVEIGAIDEKDEIIRLALRALPPIR
jgi:hypothetical protein